MQQLALLTWYKSFVTLHATTNPNDFTSQKEIFLFKLPIIPIIITLVFASNSKMIIEPKVDLTASQMHNVSPYLEECYELIKGITHNAWEKLTLTPAPGTGYFFPNAT